jgi:hypothetical protein
MLMDGAGPGFGCGLSCACIVIVKNKLAAMYINFFIFLKS